MSYNARSCSPHGEMYLLRHDALQDVQGDKKTLEIIDVETNLEEFKDFLWEISHFI